MSLFSCMCQSTDATCRMCGGAVAIAPITVSSRSTDIEKAREMPSARIAEIRALADEHSQRCDDAGRLSRVLTELLGEAERLESAEAAKEMAAKAYHANWIEAEAKLAKAKEALREISKEQARKTAAFIATRTLSEIEES